MLTKLQSKIKSLLPRIKLTVKNMGNDEDKETKEEKKKSKSLPNKPND